VSDHLTSPGPAPATIQASPSTTPALAPIPASAVRVARIGGTIAEAAAAAISAHTLYHLGGQLDLGPWTAWLLPAALDVYSFTALAVGYNLPADHPGQRPVLRNARLAFAVTLGANALDHFLQKAGRLVDPTVRDLLLVAVATLPPLVVERLLNLQSLLVSTWNRSSVETAFVTTDPVGEDTLAHDRTGSTPQERDASHRSGHETAVVGRPGWAAHSREVFTDLVDRLGRRPTGREFQAALADRTRALVADGQLPAGTRPPSVTSAKRFRAVLEAGDGNAAVGVPE